MSTAMVMSDFMALPEDLQEKASEYIASLKREARQRLLEKHGGKLPPRQFGLHKGKYNFDIDFDEPIEGFEPYM
ncbi:DUF2281 domain-containing protein [Dyadobacter fermentans]|uniref:DUF2281 domain-containing protein n=1 Tax=Dyadobacter fermentans TaxID=94254 RepID=UPI001CBFD8AF|nr:DUF2281 domain-containing protein [Dyadobacter fermentans]MBZ1359444.1 DUF2281 domain-containing protein [Dyadobacter fermentans]